MGDYQIKERYATGDFTDPLPVASAKINVQSHQHSSGVWWGPQLYDHQVVVETSPVVFFFFLSQWKNFICHQQLHQFLKIVTHCDLGVEYRHQNVKQLVSFSHSVKL